jgi:uncharacterized protein YprB with RNaseH-like and TPR domain
VNLNSRLSRLQSQAGSSMAQNAPKPSVSSLRERIGELEKRGRSRCSASARAAPVPRLPPEQLARALQGELIADGVIRIHQRLPLQGQLGSIPLHSLQRYPRLPGETGSDGVRHVYIDTETTGLSGGSGTLAFLVGIAVVDDRAIELTQFLLTRFAAETALLRVFAETLLPDDRLVSYNGRSYDLPLLVTRFRMQAMAHPFAELPHLDLLHPVRRLFSSRWADCRLISLERNLLGFSRVDDLPGSEAPGAWFSYVRFGHGAQLLKIVEHNRQDIISLAVAHSTLAHAIAAPRTFNVDLHALGRWLAEGSEAEARTLLQSYESVLCDHGKRFLAHLLRRAGHWPQAVAVWETLAAAGCTDSVERLAKYHEHISKDFAAARRCCERLPRVAVHEQRRKRLDEKLHRQRSHL